MFAELKKYSAIALLGLLALPTFVKTIHDFLHRDDFHCVADTAHIHHSEHHCDVCDFYFSAAAETGLPASVPELIFTRVEETGISFSALYAISIPHRSLRGPPVYSY